MNVCVCAAVLGIRVFICPTTERFSSTGSVSAHSVHLSSHYTLHSHTRAHHVFTQPSFSVVLCFSSRLQPRCLHSFWRKMQQKTHTRLSYHLHYVSNWKLTRNAWQSLAYSPLGITVCLLAKTYETHQITDHHSVWQPRPLANVAELSVVKLSTPVVQILTSQTPGSLNCILQNFYAVYRNNCQLTCCNRNWDIPIRFRTPVCSMNDDRHIAAESQHNFHFLGCSPPKLLGRFSPNFYTM